MGREKYENLILEVVALLERADPTLADRRGAILQAMLALSVGLKLIQHEEKSVKYMPVVESIEQVFGLN